VSDGPDLTVLILTYTRTTFLKSAVRSVLDGAPADGRVEVVLVKGYDDPTLDEWMRAQGVRILHVPIRELGPKYAAGIRAARGRALAFLEDDDQFLPGKVTRILEVFSDPARSIDLYHTGCRDEDLSGKVLGEFPQLEPGFNASTMTFRRAFLDPMVPWAERIEHNFDTFLAVGARVLGVRVYNEAVMRSIRRTHPGQWSWSHDPAIDCWTIWKMIRTIGKVDQRRSSAGILTVAVCSPTRRKMPTPRALVGKILVGLFAQFRWREIRLNLPEVLGAAIYVVSPSLSRQAYRKMRTSSATAFTAT
jgi:glycosyltransferase involved in cell wall biosynthesis